MKSSFHAVLNVVPDVAFCTDAGGTLTFVNAAAVRVGLDKDIGVPLRDRLARGNLRHPDGTPIRIADHPVWRAIETGRPVTGFKFLGELANGRRRWYVMSTVPIVEEGRVVGTASVLEDITTLTRLERELAEHAARLEAIVNLVADGVYVTARDGSLVFANEVGRRLLGLPAEGPLGPGIVLPRVTDADGVLVSFAELPGMRALRGETVSAFELRVTTAHGERRVRASANPLRSPDGAIYGAVVTTHDITDQVRAYAEVEAARESAEEANRLKDEFIAALSHELRAPLQPILGWTEVLRRHGNLDPVIVRALDTIRRNIRQQVRLVDDLLDLSRIVHRKLALRYETFDLREQIRAAAEPFQEAAALRRLHFELTLPPEPLAMWGDGTRVQQIVTNLIANAVRFTPAGGRVSVSLTAADREALLEVSDTGEGIAAEDLPVIFDVFRQGGHGRRAGGLGIGLDLVKRLTELHGGTVSAQSGGPGRGARFLVRLPLAEPEPAPSAGTAAAPRRLHGRSILIVEDNPDTREILKYMLELEGASVQTAGSGADGVRSAEEFRPEVVLCDIGLPDFDGLEVARRIHERADLRATRLIALTGYGRSEDVRQALGAGFEAHLTKPVNLDELLALLTIDA